MKTFEHIELLRKMEDEGMIISQHHPEAFLYIYNYSRKAQYERVWNEATLQCRGLILNADDEIVSRPFLKFFNYEEIAGNMPEEISKRADMPFEVWEKMDGSLGITYPLNGKLQIATRGSFASDQAIRANKILEKYPLLVENYDPSKTFLFEIIYPQNRIVVDYGIEEKLVLLAVIDNDSGKELEINAYAELFGMETPKRYTVPSLEKLIELRDAGLENSEGFIIVYEDGFRMKLKFEEYCLIHSIVTNVTSRSIWECLRDRKPLEPLLEMVPDEFDSWVRMKINELSSKREAIIRKVYEDFNTLDLSLPRKDIAEKIFKMKYPGMVFSVYNQRIAVNLNPISEILGMLSLRATLWEASWKLVYPKHETPMQLTEQ